MKNAQRKFDDEFQFVRKNFFPRWDVDNDWKVKAAYRTRNPHPGNVGFCDTESRTIYISPWVATKSRAKLRLVLIHETCHAISKGGHGKMWFGQMRKKKDRAIKLGFHEIADSLGKEIEEYENAQEITPAIIYERVEDVIRDSPKATFNNIIDYIAFDYAMNPEEVMKAYPRIEKVYKKAKADMEISRRTRLRFLGQ